MPCGVVLHTPMLPPLSHHACFLARESSGLVSSKSCDAFQAGPSSRAVLVFNSWPTVSCLQRVWHEDHPLQSYAPWRHAHFSTGNHLIHGHRRWLLRGIMSVISLVGNIPDWLSRLFPFSGHAQDFCGTWTGTPGTCPQKGVFWRSKMTTRDTKGHTYVS